MIKGQLNLKMYESLIQKGLVRAKEENGLVILKHSREVFWKDLWDQSPLLLEARGHAFDADTGECIVRPFHKIFNWNERDSITGIHTSYYFPFYDQRGKLTGWKRKDYGLKPEDEVFAVDKINGFMGAVTFHPKFGMIFSTTGSVTSPFAEMVRKHYELEKLPFNDGQNGRLRGGFTHLFEVVDSSDPHIVEETMGLHYLNSRNLHTGDYDIFDLGNVKEAASYLMDYRQAVKEGLEDTHEGCVIYKGNTPITKVKSKKYLFMKALARAKEGRLARIFANEDKGIADDMKPHIETLRCLYSESKWAIIPEQERLSILREIIYEN